FTDGSAAGQKTAPNGKAAKTPKDSPVPADMVQWDQMKFNVGNVSLKDKRIQAGGAQIDVGAGSQISVSGNGTSASMHGQLNLDGVSIRQGGADIKGSGGTATLDATYTKDADGGMT